MPWAVAIIACVVAGVVGIVWALREQQLRRAMNAMTQAAASVGEANHVDLSQWLIDAGALGELARAVDQMSDRFAEQTVRAQQIIDDAQRHIDAAKSAAAERSAGLLASQGS